MFGKHQVADEGDVAFLACPSLPFFHESPGIFPFVRFLTMCAFDRYELVPTSLLSNLSLLEVNLRSSGQAAALPK